MTDLSSTEMSSARSVVGAWRNNLRDRSGAWGEAARDLPPSDLAVIAARAFATTAAEADNAGDRMLDAGYLPGHPWLRELRGVASSAASQSQRLLRWADALLLAEQETEE